ncbi:MAG TPA: hypothetical protein VIL26_04580 [Clostridia bacterium]
MKLSKSINNIIDKIPAYVGVLMLMASMIFSCAYASQDMTMIAYTMLWGNGASAETVGWWFYLIGGLINYGIFELIMRVVVYFIKMQLVVINKPKVYHYTRVVFTFNYLILGAFHLIYFFFPLLQVIGTLVDFLISSIFLYIAYHLISRRFLPDFLWARALRATAIIFFVYHGFNVLMSILDVFGGVL